jgi:heat-inducible transcriptional repressor
MMMILITDAGRVEQRVIELTRDVPDAFIASIRSQLNNAMAGQSLPEVADRISGIIEGYGATDRRDVSLIISAVIEMAIERAEEKVVLAGTANLARFSDDFQMTMHPVLEALEEQVVLLRLLGDAADTVKVRIGSEQSEKNLKSTSLVTVGYGDAFGESGASLGALGILGPTRMDYAGSMAAVGAVARYVGRFISEGSYK